MGHWRRFCQINGRSAKPLIATEKADIDFDGAARTHARVAAACYILPILLCCPRNRGTYCAPRPILMSVTNEGSEREALTDRALVFFAIPPHTKVKSYHRVSRR